MEKMIEFFCGKKRSGHFVFNKFYYFLLVFKENTYIYGILCKKSIGK